MSIPWNEFTSRIEKQSLKRKDYAWANLDDGIALVKIMKIVGAYHYVIRAIDELSNSKTFPTYELYSVELAYATNEEVVLWILENN